MAVDELLSEVRALIAEREREGITGLAARVGPAEWADLIPHLDPSEVAVLVQWLPDDELPEMLAELDPAEAARILRGLSRHEAADLLEAMDPDDATDVVDAIPDAEAEQILIQMEPAEAAEIRELLAYAPDSAGGLMTPAYVAVAARPAARSSSTSTDIGSWISCQPARPRPSRPGYAPSPRCAS